MLVMRTIFALIRQRDRSGITWTFEPYRMLSDSHEQFAFDALIQRCRDKPPRGHGSSEHLATLPMLLAQTVAHVLADDRHQADAFQHTGVAHNTHHATQATDGRRRCGYFLAGRMNGI